MKKLIIGVVLALVLVGSMVPAAVFASQSQTGNGAPSGAHYNLNIIGVQNPKDVSKTSGNVIFVPLNTSGYVSVTGKAAVDIFLQPTYDGTFAVIDGNATDGSGTFAMPVNVATTYQVWVRGLGKPGGTSNMQLWAQDPVTGEWLYSGPEITINSHGNGNKFQDVSSDLFFLSDGTSVFDPAYEGYLWTYGNNGQKLVQLRFYPISP